MNQIQSAEPDVADVSFWAVHALAQLFESWRESNILCYTVGLNRVVSAQARVWKSRFRQEDQLTKYEVGTKEESTCALSLLCVHVAHGTACFKLVSFPANMGLFDLVCHLFCLSKLLYLNFLNKENSHL